MWRPCSCAFSFRTRGCGCGGHPAFPAPSVLEGPASAQLGRFRRRGDAGGCHGESSLPATNAKRLRKGALATKQSILCSWLDGMASLALAMTALGIQNRTGNDQTLNTRRSGNSTPRRLPPTLLPAQAPPASWSATPRATPSWPWRCRLPQRDRTTQRPEPSCA